MPNGLPPPPAGFAQPFTEPPAFDREEPRGLLAQAPPPPSAVRLAPTVTPGLAPPPPGIRDVFTEPPTFEAEPFGRVDIAEPEPPDLGEFAPVEVGAPPPLLAEQPPAPGLIQPPPPVTPGLAPPAALPPDPMAVDAELTATIADVQDLGDRRTVLRREAEDLQTQIALEPDEAKRAGLVARQQEVLGAMALTERDLRANQDKARVIGAEQDARMAVEADAARLEARQKARDRQRVQQEVTRLDEERNARARDVAQEEINRAKSERIETLRRGAPDFGYQTAIQMAAEEQRALNERRNPNFKAIFDRMRQRAGDVFRRSVQAATEEVSFGVDRAADLAAQQDRKRLLDAAANEAVLEDLILDTEQRIAQAANDADRQRLGLRRQAAQDQLEAARAESAVLADERARKAAQQEAKRELTQAQARKARAEAEKAERRAARVGRRRPEEAPGELFAPNQVAFPGTTEIAVTFEDTPAGRKEAIKAREILGFNGQLLDQINRLEQVIEDTAAKGVFASAGFSRSSEWVELQSQIDNLVPEVAKIGSGGFAATESDQKWAEGQLPVVPGPWNTKAKALAKVAALRRRFSDRARFALASQTRMKPEVAARLVARARPASISAADRAKVLSGRAGEILVDEGEDTATRLQALQNLSANAREEAKKRGDEDDFLPLEVAQIEAALPGIKSRVVREAAIERLSVLQGFAEDRVQEEKIKAAQSEGFGDPEEIVEPGRGARRQERLQDVATRTSNAVLRETLRTARPEVRRALRAIPGTSEVLREIEAAEQPPEEPEPPPSEPAKKKGGRRAR